MNPLRRHAGAWLLASALAAIAFHWLRIWFFPVPVPDERRYLPAVFPDAIGFSEKGGSPPHYTPYTLGPGKERAALGAVVRSDDLVPDIRGYAGPVPVLVGLTPAGKITGVALLEHHETPAYVAPLAGGDFLRQFAGRSVTDPLRLDEDIDGVTRATVTATAITAGVRRAARETARSLYGLQVPQETGGGAPRPWLPLAVLALLVAIAVASLITGKSLLRWISLLGGLAALGFWQRTYLSAVTLANILLWRLPAPDEHLFWYALMGTGIFAAVVWRNLYCARLCPFGALQELAALIAPGRLPATADEDRRARRLRFVFLWLATLAVFLCDRPEAAHYEPFSTAFDFTGGRLRWIFLAAVLGFAALRHRGWCRYFCPTGTCLQLLGRLKTKNPFD